METLGIVSTLRQIIPRTWWRILALGSSFDLYFLLYTLIYTLYFILWFILRVWWRILALRSSFDLYFILYSLIYTYTLYFDSYFILSFTYTFLLYTLIYTEGMMEDSGAWEQLWILLESQNLQFLPTHWNSINLGKASKIDCRIVVFML